MHFRFESKTSNEWYYSDLKLESEKYIDNGDLIFAWSASFGPFIWDGGRVIYHYHIWKLEFYDPESLYMKYVYNYLLSVTKRIKASGSGIAMIHMTKERMEKLVMQVPPVSEQYRIVAKVDELMALCDQLEAEQSNSADAHETLVSIILDALTQGDNFAESWVRLQEHFDVLFTTPASIDKLKQTLLQLAVMGKLVPQDPNDEPASELLKKIRIEKDRLIAEGKIKGGKPLPPIADEEKPFDLPSGWEWVKLNQLLRKIGAGSTPLGGKQVYISQGVPFLRSQNVWDEGLRLDDVAHISSETHQKMSGTHVFSGDLLFNITGASIGRCAIVPADFVTGNVSQHVTIVRSVSKHILSFLHKVMISRHVQQTVMDVQVGVSREGLSIGKLGQFIIPIPPLAEQCRIVAKVDELMALCEQLKLQLVEAGEKQRMLADVMVERAVA